MTAPEGGAIALTTANLSDARGKMKKLPNAEKKAAINYYEWDPKERRATKGGWVDPKRKASPDPKKRGSNLGRDLSKGLVDDEPFAAKPSRVTEPAEERLAEGSLKDHPKPQVIYTDGPTDGPKDDLKVIKGIGPVFEKELNGHGVYYYRQIAIWKKADIEMVENLIGKFPGRIKRDGWVKQAKALAKKAGTS